MPSRRSELWIGRFVACEVAAEKGLRRVWVDNSEFVGSLELWKTSEDVSAVESKYSAMMVSVVNVVQTA